MNPDFVYCLWNHTELESFVADEYPWLLSTYLAYPYIIQRCDVARYLLLYRYGGTYVDLDSLSLAPVSVIFTSAPIGARLVVTQGRPSRFAAHFIAVRRARDPVIRGVIAGLRRAATSPWYPPLPYWAVVQRTGSDYFTRLVKCYGDEDRVFIIPSFQFSNYVRHFLAASWQTWDVRIIRKLHLLYDHTGTVLLATAIAIVLFILATRNRFFD